MIPTSSNWRKQQAWGKHHQVRGYPHTITRGGNCQLRPIILTPGGILQTTLEDSQYTSEYDWWADWVPVGTVGSPTGHFPYMAWRCGTTWFPGGMTSSSYDFYYDPYSEGSQSSSGSASGIKLVARMDDGSEHLLATMAGSASVQVNIEEFEYSPGFFAYCNTSFTGSGSCGFTTTNWSGQPHWLRTYNTDAGADQKIGGRIITAAAYMPS